MSSSSEEAMVLWAVAGPATALKPPSLEPEQVAAVVRLADAHAVAGRMIQRLQRLERPNDDALLQLLSYRVAHHEVTARTHLAAMQELRSRLRADADVVLVKGLSTYLLTGRRETLRTGDIDLVCSDQGGPLVIATLESLGYTRTRNPFMYELGEFTRTTADCEPVEVDVHDYYPVNSYDVHLGTGDFSPRPEQQTWSQSGRLRVRRLSASDLWLARPSPDRSAIASCLPHPVAAALTLCSHAFLNYHGSCRS